MSSGDVLEIDTTEMMEGPMGRHGYVRTPASRVVNARQHPELGANVPEPQSIEQPKGFPAYENTHKGQTYRCPPDGQLMSAGIEPYRDLDGAVSPSGRPWPAMRLTPGGTLRMTWWLTARHKTAKWHYYLTKNGSGHETQPLTRAMLEPICTIHWHLDQATMDWKAPFPINDVQHWLKMPTDRTGRHILYAVWDVADTHNAFYQGIDVDFGGA